MANPQTQGQLVAATLQNMQNKAIDNISNNNALFFKMKKNGSFVSESGGEPFREKLLYAENTNTAWQDPYSQFNTDAQDYLTFADFEQKSLISSIPFFDRDITTNQSKEKLLDLVKTGVDSTIISLVNTLAVSLYSDASNPNELEGLRHLISKTPTTGTVGGISRDSYAFWRNQVYDFSTESVTPSATTIQAAMTQLYLRCLVQGPALAPDTIVTDQIFWQYYNTSLTTIQRTMSNELAQAGFETLKFRNADVAYDPNCPASTMYFLNSTFLKLKYLGIKNSADMSAKGMKGEDKSLPNLFTALPPTRPVNQAATIHPVMSLMNLTGNNFRTSGVLCL